MGDFLQGLGYFLEGFRLMFTKGVKRYVFLPIFANICFFMAFFYIGYYYLSKSIIILDSFLPSWLTWLNWLLWPILFLTFIFLTYFTFFILANLIAAPFNGILSEKAQRILDQNKVPMTEALLLGEFVRAFRRQGAFLWYYLPRVFGLLFLLLIPVLQILAPFAWFVFNAWMMMMQFIDVPMDNNQIAFNQMLRCMKSRSLLMLGFGSGILCLLLIPIINLFVMPAAVLGATKLWLKEFSEIKTY